MTLSESSLKCNSDDDCIAFTGMFAWAVVHSLPLSMSIKSVRSFRKHMAFTLLRGTLHFHLQPKVMTISYFRLRLTLSLLSLVDQIMYRIYKSNGMLNESGFLLDSPRTGYDKPCELFGTAFS